MSGGKDFAVTATLLTLAKAIVKVSEKGEKKQENEATVSKYEFAIVPKRVVSARAV